MYVFNVKNICKRLSTQWKDYNENDKIWNNKLNMEINDLYIWHMSTERIKTSYVSYWLLFTFLSNHMRKCFLYLLEKSGSCKFFLLVTPLISGKTGDKNHKSLYKMQFFKNKSFLQLLTNFVIFIRKHFFMITRCLKTI